MATLQVLCPNGRRQNVKITPNSKLLQVLEEVCQKQGFLPPEDYNLVQGRKTLDLTLAFRYSGLVNNSKLELVKSTSPRAEEDVLIALQFEDGSRQQASFKPSITLWDILLHWETQPNSPYKDKLTTINDSETIVKHPVCIYMREEVIGEIALRNTTLKQLGLTGGKAVIRCRHSRVHFLLSCQQHNRHFTSKLQDFFLAIHHKGGFTRNKKKFCCILRMVHRAVDDLTFAKIIQDVEKSNAKKVRLEDIASQKYLEQQSQSATQLPSSSNQSTDTSTSSAATITQNMDMTSHTEAKPNIDNENLEPMDVDTVTSGQAGLSTTNQPDSTISTSNTTTDNSINRLREMNIPGVDIFTPQDFADLSPQEQAIATRLAHRFVPGLMRSNNQTAVSSSTQSRQPRQIAPSFTDFKFPEETKGKDVYHNELSAVNREEFKPCDRESILYSLEETLITSKVATEELSDDFFEINENDLRIMMTDLQKKVESMDNEMLMTKSLRQAALEEKYNKYEKVIIRIQFPNKLVLQGLFRPRETVFAIHKYVKENLEDKNMTFYLYTTPPKTVLKDQSQTLLEANLVPATLIHFGSQVEHDSYVTLSLVSSISPRLKAEELVAKCLKSDEISSSNSEYKKPQTSRSSNTAGSSSSGSSEPKVPKWLKLGKK